MHQDRITCPRFRAILLYVEQDSPAFRYNSDDPDASNDGASNYSYDGMEPPLILSRQEERMDQ